MKQPRPTRSLRSARLAPSILSLTPLKSAGIDDVPDVLERSELRLSDVKSSAQGVPSKGILVKLFLISRKDTRSAGDAKQTVWVVGSPDATNWTTRKSEVAYKVDVGATDKASHAAKASSTSKPGAKTKVSRGKARRQKELRSPAKGGRNVAEQPVQEGHSDLTDTSDGQEGEAGDEEEDNTGEDDAGEDEDLEGPEAGEEEAGEDDAAVDDAGVNDAREDDAGEDIEKDLHHSEEEEDLDDGQEKNAAVDEENGRDIEEQDDDGHDKPLSQAEAEEADEMEDEDYASEEALAEDTVEKGEQEIEGQQEGEREGESDGEDTTSDEAQMRSKTTRYDNASQVGQEEEHKDDGEKGSVRDHGEVREDTELVEQRVAANHLSGAWRSWAPGYANGREEEIRGTTSEGGEGTVEADDGSGEGKRKRDFEGDGAMGTSTLEEYPKKRNKSTREDDESDAVMEDLFERDMETPLRPTTPSPMFPTLSPESTIKTVRQTSVVPGLEDTEMPFSLR